MRLLSTGLPAPRPERPATHLLHDEPSVRVVAFHLEPGQHVPPHHSTSTVMLQVLEGEGVFRGADGEARLRAGEGALFAPGEPHEITADAGALRFLAIITPRPGA